MIPQFVKPENFNRQFTFSNLDLLLKIKPISTNQPGEFFSIRQKIFLVHSYFITTFYSCYLHHQLIGLLINREKIHCSHLSLTLCYCCCYRCCLR
jgi:hypothetical protein